MSALEERFSNVTCERCADGFVRDNEDSISRICASCIEAEERDERAEAYHDAWLHDAYDRAGDR